MRPVADRPSLADPRILVATGLGSGYLPRAPGTWGSLLAAVAAWPIAGFGGGPGLIAAAVVAAAIGLPAIAAYQRASGQPDPREVVIDEVAGQWLALAACPPDPAWWLAGFAAFRVFDIVKPPPIRWVDRHVKTAAGVMLDDLLAGIYAAGTILLVRWVLAAT